MSNKLNHRRKNKEKPDVRYDGKAYHNGYSRQHIANEGEEVSNNDSMGRVGKTGYLDKSMHGWGSVSKLADKHIGAGIGNDFCNGHRGMAKAVKGAKKFVRTRTRFHENAATRQLMNENSDEI